MSVPETSDQSAPLAGTAAAAPPLSLVLNVAQPDADAAVAGEDERLSRARAIGDLFGEPVGAPSRQAALSEAEPALPPLNDPVRPPLATDYTQTDGPVPFRSSST